MFEVIEPGVCRCKRCGFVARSRHPPAKIYRWCDHLVAVDVLLCLLPRHRRRLAAQFARGLARHARDWFRRRSRAEQLRIVAICQACERYDAANEVCTVCGCTCSAKSQLRNKVAWRTEHCPLTAQEHGEPPKW